MKESLTDATIRFLTEGLHRNSTKLNKKVESKDTNKVNDLVEIGDILTDELNQKVMEYCTSVVDTKEGVINTLNEEPKILTPELEKAINNTKGNTIVVYFIAMQEQSKLDNADTIILGLDENNTIVDKQLLTIENSKSDINEANSNEIEGNKNLVENNDDTYVAVANGVIYWEGSAQDIEDDERVRLIVQDAAQEDGLNIDTDEVDIMKKSEFESKQILTETKSVSEYTDDIDLIIAIESDNVKIETEDELNRLKAICEKLQNSQGFYGRLLNQLNQIDISNLPVIL